MIRKMLMLVILLQIPIASYSKTEIICESPNGSRVDYWKNSDKYPNNEFLTDDDKISGIHPTITISDNNDITFSTADSGNINPISSTMTLLLKDSEQMSFSGVMDGAPVLASYYPKLKILVYSQHSDWTPYNTGMRSTTYYSRCVENNN